MNEKTCDKPATHRFTWPGNDESFICEDHLPKLKAVAQALGLHLQTIAVPDGDEQTCRQREPK
jgi:hypothetical protein